MRLRSALTLFALILFPAFTRAQDGAVPGGAVWESRTCPEGQIFDEETKACIVLFHLAFQPPLTPRA